MMLKNSLATNIQQTKTEQASQLSVRYPFNECSNCQNSRAALTGTNHRAPMFVAFLASVLLSFGPHTEAELLTSLQMGGTLYPSLASEQGEEVICLIPGWGCENAFLVF